MTLNKIKRLLISVDVGMKATICDCGDYICVYLWCASVKYVFLWMLLVNTRIRPQE